LNDLGEILFSHQARELAVEGIEAGEGSNMLAAFGQYPLNEISLQQLEQEHSFVLHQGEQQLEKVYNKHYHQL